MLKIIFTVSLVSAVALAHVDLMTQSDQPVTVLTNLDQAQAVGGIILSRDIINNLAVAKLTNQKLEQLSRLNHFQGRCAGFEVLNETEALVPSIVLNNLITFQNQIVIKSPLALSEVPWNESYQKIADLTSADSLKETIRWISSYPSRNDKLSAPNAHVIELKVQLENWLSGAKWPYQIEFVSHISTRQNSLKLTIPGKLRPSEVIVLGAHYDSVNQSFFGGSKKAPGADDNASGASNLIEALKALKFAEQPERTLEFYWYAGEESGLLGSAEIAKAARAQEKNVIAVLQLDMTLYPGSGEQVIGLITDYTSPWLRDIFTRINDTYVKARLLNDECGYGCSDHASWHRQKYNAVIPFEAISKTMNQNIHSEMDLLDSKSSVQHSNSFTKYAVLFALVLGNSNLNPPIN